jgi:hypothetical protein
MYWRSSCCHRHRVSDGLWIKLKSNWDQHSCPEKWSWMFMKQTLTSCDWLWMSHSSPGVPQEWQICHQITWNNICSTLHISVCGYLITFAYILNQRMRCTHCHLSTHFMLSNRERLPLGLCYYMNLYSVSMWRLLLQYIKQSVVCQLSFGGWLPCTRKPEIYIPGHLATSLTMIMTK